MFFSLGMAGGTVPQLIFSNFWNCPERVELLEGHIEQCSSCSGISYPDEFLVYWGPIYWQPGTSSSWPTNWPLYLGLVSLGPNCNTAVGWLWYMLQLNFLMKLAWTYCRTIFVSVVHLTYKKSKNSYARRFITKPFESTFIGSAMHRQCMNCQLQLQFCLFFSTRNVFKQQLTRLLCIRNSLGPTAPERRQLSTTLQ